MTALKPGVIAISCCLAFAAAHASAIADAQPTLTVPVQVLITPGQAAPAITVSFSYLPEDGDCASTASFNWDSAAWASAPLANPSNSDSCIATLTMAPPAGASGPGQHTVCAVAGSARACTTLTIVVKPAATPTPVATPRRPPTSASPTTTASPSAITAAAPPESTPSAFATPSGAAAALGTRGGSGAPTWGGAAVAVVMVLIAIAGCGLAMRSMVRAGSRA